jgi:hypothetical protein
MVEASLQKGVGSKQLHLDLGISKKYDGLISGHEELRLFKESVIGSIIQSVRRDIPNS